MAFTDRLHNRGSISTGYDIDNSLKLEADNSEYLNRTPGANGSRTTWTTSVWVKRTEIGVDQAVFSSVSNASTTNFCRFTSDDKIRFYFQPDDVAATYYADTNAVFRDTSAWYHIVWGLDSTNSDGSKRFVVYVNGVYQESTWAGSATASTNCPQNSGSRFLQSEPIYIGKATYTNGHYFNGYMADLHVLDGIAPDPTDFGEYDEDSGIWKPKAYTGSHGTQGFYLDFSDAANLGDDASGNGNNFTENNITSADQATDTPTNNFCTLNGLTPATTSAYTTEGGTTYNGSWSNPEYALMASTFGVSRGKWYWEVKNSGTNGALTGTGAMRYENPNYDTFISGTDGGIATYYTYGTAANKIYYFDGSAQTSVAYSSFPNAGTGDIISIALDMDNGKIYFAINNTWGNSGNPATGTNPVGLPSGFITDTYTPAATVGSAGTSTAYYNFGGYTEGTISSPASDENGYGTFEYAPPSGYYALCTKNLAEYG